MGNGMRALDSLPFVLVAILASGCERASSDEEQIRRGYEAASTAPVTKLAHEVTTFEYEGRSFELLPPEGFELTEVTQPLWKTFVLSGPKEPAGTSPVISVSVIVPGPDQSADSAAPLIEAILAPYEKYLAGYSRAARDPFASNGLTFEGASFSGRQGGTAVQGTVLGTSRGNVVYILFSMYDAQQSDQFEGDLWETIRSFRVVDNEPSRIPPPTESP
jgi:hypothetical protein